MKKMSKCIGLVMACVAVMLLSGCASQLGFEEAAVAKPVGFWHGLWHGMVAPIAWFFGLFFKDIAVYAIYNNGGWYDFGYMLGIGAFGCGCTSSSK